MYEIVPHEFRDKKLYFTQVGTTDLYNHFMTFCLERDVREEWWDIKEGDVVIDVGAGHGAYSLTAMAVGAALVLAFEPSKEEGFALTNNSIVNSWLDRILLVPMLLGESTQLVRYLPPVTGLGVLEKLRWFPHWFRKMFKAKQRREEARFMVTLDTFLGRYGVPKLDWIKIDVEGMELDVLKGASGTIKQFRPRLLIENHVGYVPSIDLAIREFFAPLGYCEENRTGVGINDNWSRWTPNEKVI